MYILYKITITKFIKQKYVYNRNRLNYNHLFSVNEMHIHALSRGTISITPTMLRLISPLGESDGRCVHVSDYHIQHNIIIYIYYQVQFH